MTPNDSRNDMAGSFEAVEDFIALVDSEDEAVLAVEVPVPEKDKGKGKAKARDDDQDAALLPAGSFTVTPTDQQRTREWDRGKPNGLDRTGKERDNGKRKYGSAFEPNDGYENKKQRMDAKSRKSPWVKDIEWERCRNVAELCVFGSSLRIRWINCRVRLHLEVEAFANWMSPTSEEDEVRGLIVSLISQAVTKRFPDARVLPFGSYATKLYLPLGYAQSNCDCNPFSTIYTATSTS